MRREAEHTVKSRDYLGVDVGVKVLATCSDGTVFENPRAYKKAQNKLTRLQRELNRRQLGSANRNKTKLKLARAAQRIANIRKDAIHKLTSAALQKPRSHRARRLECCWDDEEPQAGRCYS